MARKDRKARQARRRTSPTVVRTHLAVITGVTNDASGPSVKREIELVKASMLYADTVEVLSLGNQMIREIANFAAGDATNLWGLLSILDDSTLRHLVPDSTSIDQFRQALPILALDPESVRGIVGVPPEKLDELANILDQTQTNAAESMAELRQVAHRLRVDSGVAELEIALHNRLVRFNEDVTIADDRDLVITSFMNQFKRYLQDPTRFVLLDADMASMARAMINEGVVRLPDRAVSNAGEVALGTGFLARLPAFTTAPMDEVLNLRNDLDEPLGRYRRKVSHLRGDLQTEPFHQQIDAEIDAIWRAEIDPAVLEIRQAMADHGLVREVLRSLSGNLSDFVKGGWLPAGVTVFSADMLDLNKAVATGLAGTALAAPTVASAVRNRIEGRATARRHDLYYLYEVNRRLSP